MTYRECYERGTGKLKAAGVPESALDARLLLEHVCGTDCNDLFAHGDRPVEQEQAERYALLVKQRAGRVPLQYLTGEQVFYGHVFAVNEHVLIPRQDTEILVEEALKRAGREDREKTFRVLDLCTGSGCILISLMAKEKGICGVGVDISGEALAVARANAERLLAPDNRPLWVCADLFGARDAEPEQFDMIVSNPPYIKSGEIAGLMPEVREHEPLAALDGSGDGLRFYREIAGRSGAYLKSGGWLLLEIGCEQGAAVTDLLDRAGFEELSVRKDYAGLDRVVSGRKP